MLSACAVSTPPAVTSARGALPPPQIVRIVTAIDDETVPAAEVIAFAGRLEHSLAARGVTISPDGPYLLTVALSRRNAAVGITQAKEGGRKSIRWLSPQRRSHPLQVCKPQRMQVSLVGREQSEGEPAYIGRGVFDHCARSKQPVDGLVAALAADFTQR